MEAEKSQFNAGLKYSGLFVDLLEVCIIASSKKDAYTWFSSLNSMFYAMSKNKIKKEELEYINQLIPELHSLVYDRKIQAGTLPFDLYIKLSNYQQQMVTIIDRAGLLTATVDENANLLR